MTKRQRKSKTTKDASMRRQQVDATIANSGFSFGELEQSVLTPAQIAKLPMALKRAIVAKKIKV